MKEAQEALNNHPTAQRAHVNAEGVWYFCTPPADFEVVAVLEKGAIAENEKEAQESQTKNKRKK